VALWTVHLTSRFNVLVIQSGSANRPLPPIAGWPYHRLPL
jgi:hypothetical protein